LNLALGRDTIKKIKQVFGRSKEMKVHNKVFDCKSDEEQEKTDEQQEKIDDNYWDWTNLNEEERIMLH